MELAGFDDKCCISKMVNLHLFFPMHNVIVRRIPTTDPLSAIDQFETARTPVEHGGMCEHLCGKGTKFVAQHVGGEV